LSRPDGWFEGIVRPVGNLTGKKVGRFRLVEKLGEGSGGSVYRGRPESGGGQEVAIRILDPELLSQLGFLERFERDIRTVAGIRHPHLLRLYEYGSSGGITGLAMELARGGSLRDELEQGPVSAGRAVQVIQAVSSALDAAHEAGLFHGDIKPTNILLDDRRQPKVADFGLARAHFTYAVGTPGYLAPELALGRDVDRPSDVYSLAVLAFEMLTGRQPYADEVGPNRIVATVMAPVPQASRLRRDLAPEIDAVFMRALAKSPHERHPTTQAFAEDLCRALAGEPQAVHEAPAAIDIEAFGSPLVQPELPTGNNHKPHPDAELAPIEEPLEEPLADVVQTPLLATIVVDQTGYIVNWNSKAEELFGWTSEQMVGRSIVSTIVPPRHREAHDRGFRRYVETGEGQVIGKVMELSALRSDGHEFQIELSIAPAGRSGSKGLLVGFVRDITKEKTLERFQTAQAEVNEVLRSGISLERALPRVFEALGKRMGWTTGAFWSPEADHLVCRYFWRAEGFECQDFEQATLDARFKRDIGLAGRVWASGDPIWVPDVLDDPTMTRALPALRAGLHCAVVFPVLESGEVGGVIELLSPEVRQEDDELMMRFFDVGRRLGRLKAASGTETDLQLNPEA
jgi:PAS domain S-box-containing protein